jgi:D-alanyl-lipoteichoic acid acyltransferase DltB (MBOAT superfamily)
MYLTDLRAGLAPRYGLVRYAFYIAFFPQLLAGPLVRWSEIMHQTDERPYGGRTRRSGSRAASCC